MINNAEVSVNIALSVRGRSLQFLATGRLGVRLLFAVALCATIAASAIAQDDKPPRKFTFGSMGVAMRADLTVYQGGARDEQGNIVIKENDQLRKWHGKELKTLDDFCRALYATKPGELVDVEISRPAEGDKRETLTVKIKLGDPRVAYKELYTHLDQRKRAFDWRQYEAVNKGGPLRDKVLPLLKEHKLERAWDDLVAAHDRELDLWNSYENLSSTDLLLSDPLASHQWIKHIGEEMAAGRYSAMMLALLDADAARIGAYQPPELPPADDNKKDALTWFKRAGDAILAELVAVDMRRAIESAEARATAVGQLRDIEFHWRGSPGFEKSSQAVQLMRGLEIDAARPVAALPHAIRLLKTLADGYWNNHKQGANLPVPVGVDMSKFVEGEAVCFHTSYGLIAIGGPDRNVWKGGPDSPAVIFDVDGDDEYIDCAVTSGDRPASIVIDLAGNDRYRSTGKWGVACGMLGTAIIIDEAGDDTYEAGDWGIGAALGGVGLIFDLAGNDRYLGGSNSIGCAAWGIGGVIDMTGNDIYDAHVYSVGCGQPGGVGFVLDFAGDDRYRCTGKQPSGYGTRGEWMGGGIGCGFGWRTLACGGVGLVVDVAGNDVYDAGEFGLGCGYFMAVGAVRDMDGDDVYLSSRYGLATGAHAGVGVFMDDKGNDVYEGKTAASMGGVWDIVTGYFYDGVGNDFYRCDGLGLGAAAQNAFGIFWDASGDDVYRAGGSSIGDVGAYEYAGGRLARNFGIFIDSGGDDSYPPRRQNKSKVVEKEYAIFWDE
ncbi:MAG: hypothetical protein KF696_12140 [Planctomycetes bacterium]|nr:hypothetical protein [Planctomycetota bacterium]MCW8136550.1 hypothetical protein [Planctomycetota bacterium]